MSQIPDKQAERLNPYKGARPFKFGETIFGRDREIAELLDLVIAERIVLLHSPSGAGKTSLVQAGLTPALQNSRFKVLPVIRLNHEPPDDVAETDGDFNRYVYSALLSLEEGRPVDQCLPDARLRTMTLSDYLTSIVTPESLPSRVLVFDQFEEILTSSATDKSQKENFFNQVGEALSNRRNWALFSMREDYVAALSPYVRWIPSRLTVTYRLDLLDAESASLAILEPARALGVDFQDEATKHLINDLSTMRVPSGGTLIEQKGTYIEPVQLQVVCYRLWEKLPLDANAITVDDIRTGEDVNQALAGYYAQAVSRIAEKMNFSERKIRDWFTTALITPQGLRGQVMSTGLVSGGLEDTAIRELVDVYLVRAEKRRNVDWFELAHDRLIEPVQQNNAEWLKTHLNEFQRQAAFWAQQSRPDSLLLHDTALVEAEAWATAHKAELTDVESEFLQECLEARTERDKESERLRAQAIRDRKHIRQFQILLIVLGGITAIAIISVFLVLRSNRISLSRQLTMKATSELENNPDTALLLGVLAYEKEASADARATLLKALHYTANVEAFLFGHSEPVWKVAISPDGKIIASVAGPELKLWDTSTHKLIVDLDTKGATNYAVGFNHDGKLLVTADVNGTFCTWDITNRAKLKETTIKLDSHGPDLRWNFAISKTRDEVIVRTDYGFTLWDLKTWKQLGVYSQSEGLGPYSASQKREHRTMGFNFVSSDETLTVLNGAGELFIWGKLDQPPTVKTLPAVPSGPAFFSPDGRFFAVADDNFVAIYDTLATPATRSQTHYKIEGLTSEITALAFNASGSQLAIGDASGSVRVVDNQLLRRPGVLYQGRHPPEFTASVGHNRDVSSLVFTADGWTLISGGADAKLIVWRFGESPLGVSLGSGEDFDDAEFSHDGKQLITCNRQGDLKAFDVATGTLATTLHSDPNVYWQALGRTASGEIIAAGIKKSTNNSSEASHNSQNEIVVFVRRGQETKSFRTPAKGNDGGGFIAFSPDVGLLAVVPFGGPITLWDPYTLQQRGKALELNSDDVSWSEGNPRFVVFNHAKTKLVATDGDGRMVVWDLVSSARLASYFPGKNDKGSRMVDMAYSHDDSMLAGIIEDRIVLLRIGAAKPERVVNLYRNEYAMSISFSPDDKILALNTIWETTLLFHTESGQRLGPPIKNSDTTCESTFSPDGKKLAIRSCSGSGVLIWDLDPTSWIEHAKRIANRELKPEDLP